MTTRIAKVSTTSRKPRIQLLCPACRGIRTCTPVGAATVAGKRRDVVECGDKTCGLQWIPTRQHLPKPTPNAAP